MKTVLQISKETKISKSTLLTRLRALNIRPKSDGKTFFLSASEEEKVLQGSVQYTYKNPFYGDYMILNSKMNYE